MTSIPLSVTLRSLDTLPVPARFRELCIANAALDAILMPDWEFRYFSFNSQWDSGEQMASLRDGSGSHHFVLFRESGVFVKGFDVDSPLNTPYTNATVDWRTSMVPDDLRVALNEPAFDMEDLSFCFWATSANGFWVAGKPPKDELLDIPLGHVHLLLDDPAVFAAWASEYYERSVPTRIVRLFHQLVPLDESILHNLNGALQLEDIIDDLRETGYPLR